MIHFDLYLGSLNKVEGIPDLLRHAADRIEAGDFHLGHTRSIMSDGERVGGYNVSGDEVPA